MATPQRRSDYSSTPPRHPQVRTGPLVIGENLFRGLLVRERNRADRSNQPLALVFVALHGPAEMGSAPIWRAVVDALAAAKRETDVLGWFEEHKAIGLIVPEVPASNPAFPRELSDRFRGELSRRLDPHAVRRLSIRLHVHPPPHGGDAEGVRAVDPVVTRVRPGDARPTHYDAVKRTLDVAISLMSLTLLSPLFLVLAALVKLTSSGPVFFRQERVGQLMKPFTMLKFRTMRVDADHAIHHEFVSSFIKSGRHAAAVGKTGLFKIADVGRALTSSRSSGTCCVGRCRWSVLGLRCRTKSRNTSPGTGVASSRPNPD